jgi:hypothetical protein
MIDFLLFGLGIGLAVAAAEVRKHERKRKKLGGECGLHSPAPCPHMGSVGCADA